jgi:hypothetical protein
MNNNSESYYRNYHELITNQGLVGLMAILTHRSLESRIIADNRASQKEMKIIEVGAGQGQHVKYVEADYKSYLMTDLRPSLLSSFQIENPKIKIEQNSIDAEILP